MSNPRVSFVTRVLTHYRIPFHEQVRELLAEQGVEYQVIHGQPDAEEAAKQDLATLPWAKAIRNRPLFGRGKLVWQPVLESISGSDLVILGQENQLLVNYPLQIMRKHARRIALFGHGRNFQSRNPGGLAERWKRFWAKRCDWWFAYTDETSRHLVSIGYPGDRITVFNNAVDTSALREQATALGSADIQAAKAALGITGSNVAVFVGGLYPDKRIEFLVDAADRVRESVPDFELVIIGAGIDAPKLAVMAETRPWLIVAGPRFGSEKVALMMAARLFLMPGLVGLAVLDAGVLGLPMVTTAFPWHSPEIAYLRDGENGVIVEAWEDVDAYAEAMIALLRDEEGCRNMAARAVAAASHYSVEAMAERFADGVLRALR
ncbi:MAG: glycosyltransferase family 4 protein [Pseudomonadota bacterium]